MRINPLSDASPFGRLGCTALILTAAGAILPSSDAMAQLGLSYDWAQRYGGNANQSWSKDYGRGVAILTDGAGDEAVGTVVSCGEYTGNYLTTGGTTTLKAYTTFVTPTIGGGLDTWSRQFKEVNSNGGNATANGVAAATPFVEGTLRHAFTVGSFNGLVDFGSSITRTGPTAPVPRSRSRRWILSSSFLTRSSRPISRSCSRARPIARGTTTVTAMSTPPTRTVFNADWTNHVKKADLDWDGDWDSNDQSIYTILKNIGCCS